MYKIINLFNYLFFYFGLKKRSFKIKKNINFGSEIANKFFLSKIKQINYYLEFGSGSSTILADSINKNYLSIELDKSFFNQIIKDIKNKEKIILINIGPTKYDSIPLIPLFFLKKKNQ